MENGTQKAKPGKKTKRSPHRKKYPLREKPVIYRDPFGSVFDEFNAPRVPGIDKDKVTILPDFDKPLPGFEG